MPQSSYSDPVSQLLTIGDPLVTAGTLDWQSAANWIDYQAAFSLDASHIPELIRLATDEDLLRSAEDTAETWAPLHAWRALGQLRAVEAIQPLLGLFRYADDENNDWMDEDFPHVMAMIGPAAIPPVAEYLANSSHGIWARITAAISLQRIGTAHPSSRLDCVHALTAVLEKYISSDEMLNGELIASLAELNAVEAAPLVEQAYKADRVDESILGDWEDFQVEVGLLEERITDPEYDLDFNPFFPTSFGEPGKRPVKKETKQVKKKRKQAKESRKKNRKKKK